MIAWTSNFRTHFRFWDGNSTYNEVETHGEDACYNDEYKRTTFVNESIDKGNIKVT